MRTLIYKDQLLAHLEEKLRNLKAHTSGFSSDHEAGMYSGKEAALEALIDDLVGGTEFEEVER